MTNTPQKSKNVQTLKETLETITHLTAPCLECTTCASCCPVFQSDPERNPRQIIYRIANGNFDEILDQVDFWWCGACYSCEAHCPQEVPLTHIFFQLKNLAFQAGKFVPQPILRTGRRLSDGFLYPLDAKILKKRKQLNLPPLKKPAVKKINLILKFCGFNKLLAKYE